jgi:hypothetical protein
MHVFQSLTKAILVRLVNGEHRIGIFASEYTSCPHIYIFPIKLNRFFAFSGKNLSAGAEVFLDYGDLFFQDESDVNEKKKKRGGEVSIANLLELDQHSSDETYNE